jgi:hypothetical protein
MRFSQIFKRTIDTTEDAEDTAASSFATFASDTQTDNDHKKGQIDDLRHSRSSRTMPRSRPARRAFATP